MLKTPIKQHLFLIGSWIFGLTFFMHPQALASSMSSESTSQVLFQPDVFQSLMTITGQPASATAIHEASAAMPNVVTVQIGYDIGVLIPADSVAPINAGIVTTMALYPSIGSGAEDITRAGLDGNAVRPNYDAGEVTQFFPARATSSAPTTPPDPVLGPLSPSDAVASAQQMINDMLNTYGQNFITLAPLQKSPTEIDIESGSQYRAGLVQNQIRCGGVCPLIQFQVQNQTMTGVNVTQNERVQSLMSRMGLQSFKVYVEAYSTTYMNAGAYINSTDRIMVLSEKVFNNILYGDSITFKHEFGHEQNSDVGRWGLINTALSYVTNTGARLWDLDNYDANWRVDEMQMNAGDAQAYYEVAKQRSLSAGQYDIYVKDGRGAIVNMANSAVIAYINAGRTLGLAQTVSGIIGTSSNIEQDSSNPFKFRAFGSEGQTLATVQYFDGGETLRNGTVAYITVIDRNSVGAETGSRILMVPVAAGVRPDDFLSTSLDKNHTLLVQETNRLIEYSTVWKDKATDLLVNKLPEINTPNNPAGEMIPNLPTDKNLIVPAMVEYFTGISFGPPVDSVGSINMVSQITDVTRTAGITFSGSNVNISSVLNVGQYIGNESYLVPSYNGVILSSGNSVTALTESIRTIFDNVSLYSNSPELQQLTMPTNLMNKVLNYPPYASDENFARYTSSEITFILNLAQQSKTLGTEASLSQSTKSSINK